MKSRENFTNELCSAIEKNKRYKELNYRLYEFLDKINNKELAYEIENILSSIEIEVEEICYGIGFAHAVKLITASYGKNELSNNSDEFKRLIMS
ncbi:MAG: hypothetical protein PHV03_00275 [Desulfitobacteriaceae bacterium]|nr:hypothetical protein [Desulfitobacteriaceae bacterium]MDD4400324.1 hypothetical protein [Desulfitobacteriaceae bacterium]